MDNPKLKYQIQTLLDLGLTLTAIARAASINTATIRSWVNGLRTINDTNEQKLKEYVANFKEQISNL